MSIRDSFKYLSKILKIPSVIGLSGIFIAYHVRRTYRFIEGIVNTDVLDIEKKYTAEYIYIDDPSYSRTLITEHDKEKRQSILLSRIWKSLKHSLAWRLLWLCRHGNPQQRNIALDQLAAFKNNKVWDYTKLAQAIDKNTAVLLARTRGADLRYFLPPPAHVRRAAASPELLSFKLRDLIVAANKLHPHSCLKHFLAKHFANIQDQAMEADTIPAKPDSISERDLCLLCLDAIYHHLRFFYNPDYNEDQASAMFIEMGLLPCLAEIMLRNYENLLVDVAVLHILTVLSVHTNLLTDFFQNGLIRELSRLVRSKDVRLSCSAAVCLANLSGEYCYRPGLYLLHPIFRTDSPPRCDTVLIHGLRGGVFVTWRQRDRKCAEPLGIMEVAMTDSDEVTVEKTEEVTDTTKYIDPEMQQVLKELIELEDDALLADVDVVLHDLPTEAQREPKKPPTYIANEKHKSLIQEKEDSYEYTYCWPKEWLPKDCNNLRILGINYWSSLSEWLERCPLQTNDIAGRASELVPTLVDAGVGTKNVPVVWLAHSMGGLIVKQVLTECAQSENPDFNKLCESTRAVLFYSTPHKGSALANMPRAAAAVLWPSADVRQLQENSPILLELQQSFIKFADKYDWETISFAETMPTLVTAFKVPVHFVEVVSADLGRGVFYQLPLDHLCICKPATRQSVLYTTVLDVIQRITNEDLGVKYHNPFIEWLLSILWMMRKGTGNKVVIESREESEKSDGYRWVKQVLFDSFSHGSSE